MNMMAIIWLALLIVFVILEAATVQLISTWFAVGALAAMVVSLLGAPLWLQLLVFFTVSIVLLATLWPMARKHLKAKVVATNADALVGKVCKVTEDIDPLEGGRVKVGDVTWSARTESGEAIPAGTQVEILKIQGAKVFVAPVKKEVEV
jgi:membrane protein implicated in regulation of membrane protease activity